MRLHRFLALSGLASRRQCEHIIAAGRVHVNGHVMDKLGTTVDPDHDIVEVDGKRVEFERAYYVLLYKPRGYLSTVVDSRGRRTVNDLVSDLPVRLYPVGRLDLHTEGVLLMTNDGALCHRLTHPSFGVEKTYRAVVKGQPSREALRKLQKGLEIEKGRVTSPAKIRFMNSREGKSTLEITIHEGRKRQVRRMCEAIGHAVVSLKRTKFDGIHLGKLKPGQYRLLTQAEVSQLKQLTGLSND